MTTTPALTVVVAAYERADVLELVLHSLQGQTFADFEVIVADDGSGPSVRETTERFSGRARFALSHLWHEDDGFRKTIIVNRAVARARGDYLVFIDADCLLHHRFLERHHRRARRKQVLSGRRVMFDAELSARVTTADVSNRRVEKISYWIGHCGKNDRRNGLYLPFAYHIKNAGRDDYEILGCNFSVHKDDFYDINGYDERIVGRGLEDNNLCVRFRNGGYKLKCITHEALQYHLHHATDPIPHSPEVVERYRSSAETRTPYGIRRD